MSLPRPLPTFPAEEYQWLERGSELRHEYLDGLVYAMAGESLAHSTICFNLAALIGPQLRGTPCRGFSPNMKVRTGTGRLYAYPDQMIVCGEPKFHDKQRDVLLNPTVIIEVLSPSTEAYDRGEKFLRYRTEIESLQDYVLVAQHEPRVEHYRRQPGDEWPMTAVSGLDAVLELPTIACRLPLSEVYDRVAFGDG
ncbi:MAG TPA: Uma2 family endonuclease [Pyrinomonadaceae bacterium]|jgi:Uma2 family endonuclease